jgi:prepilin-type N-terminal cleavage/methylation domain-containing protein
MMNLKPNIIDLDASADFRFAKSKTAPGFTLIELIMAMAAACVVMMTAALLVASGQKSWSKTFNSANSEARLGSLDSMVALGAVGRKSNKVDYRLYKLVSGSYQRALPLVNPEEVVIGHAIEFRYWEDELSTDYMNPALTADKYAIFYLDSGRLKMSFGPYPPGGIDGAGHIRTGAGITTVTLTENVSSAEFSHTTYNMAGDGYGCIRMKLIITDPADGTPKTTLAATFMRNVWPQ